MAVTVIAPEALTRNAFDLDAIAMTAPTTAADGFTVDLSAYADQNVVLLFQNSGAVDRTVTIKKGNGLQGTADLASGNIAAGKFGAITIESGKFKNVTGTLKGKLLIIPAHAELKMAALVI
jgi:hypothetical protein